MKKIVPAISRVQPIMGSIVDRLTVMFFRWTERQSRGVDRRFPISIDRYYRYNTSLLLTKQDCSDMPSTHRIWILSMYLLFARL
jgi:hypothetical protein